MTNPLLKAVQLPEFSHIKPGDIEPAIDQVLAQCRSRVRELESTALDASWEVLVAPLEEIDDQLQQVWSPVSHLNAVMNSEEFRAAYKRCLPKLSEYYTERGQSQTLFNAYKQLSESDEFADLDDAQKKTIQNALRDFKLSGIELGEEGKKRYGEIKKRLSELQNQFSDNVLDATQAWSKLVIDEKSLAGLPATALQGALQTAKQRGSEGYLLTLDVPCYLPVQTYCDDRELRREMYEAYVTRASDQGPNPGTFDNSMLIQEILMLREELSILLGYNNYAELSLATKMAGTTSRVVEFLDALADKSYPAACRDMEEIAYFARTSCNQNELCAWDVAYYAEKLRQQRYAISQEELRPYFPAPVVLEGLFEVVKRLYDINVRQQVGWDVWHADVRCYEIEKHGKVIARFFLDLYARQGKRGGAWMDVCKTRRVRLNGELQIPVAYLTCNFTQPLADKPALLTHDEVITLFHEFGHGLHHMLTRVDYAEVSGINGVAWDAVELPSQFMENWCWQPEALSIISGHVETGEPLPNHLLDKMLAARNFMSAMQMVRQLEFGIFDFKMHMTAARNGEVPVQQIVDQVRQQVAVIKYPENNRFQHAFSHIFAGGYAAGYYSYKWAEVLSADAFSRFMAEGVFNRQTGERFLETILEAGGSREPMELFVEFMGREPDVEALLRQEGILPAKANQRVAS